MLPADMTLIRTCIGVAIQGILAYDLTVKLGSFVVDAAVQHDYLRYAALK